MAPSVPALADELAYRAADLHRLMHRVAEHLVNGKDREPRSLALVEALWARHGLKHDDTKSGVAEPLDRVAIEESMRAPELDIESALILKAPRSADDRAACIDDIVKHDDAAALDRFADDIERTR